MQASVVFGLVFIVICRSVAAATATTHPAQNVDPQAGPPGMMPYEMEGRTEPGLPLFGFDDLSRWEVRGRNAEGWLYRTQDQRLWSQYSAKLVYLASGPDPVLDIRPARPVPIPDPWDLVNFWTFGNVWGWMPDPKTPFVSATILLRDATGREFTISPGIIDHAYWFMMCARLSAQQKSEYQRPFSFTGFRIEGGKNTEKRAVYLGPCYFAPERLEPLAFAPWPDKLRFPTRPETILPTNKTADFRNETNRQGDAWTLSYVGKDASLQYVYLPRTGTLGDIEVRYDGKTLRPCAGGGVQLAGPAGPIDPADSGLKRTLRSCEQKGDSVAATWELRRGEIASHVTYSLRIQQKSLVIDIAADQPVVDRVLLGRAEPPANAKLFKIPYLTFGWYNTDPHVLHTAGLFLFSQFDWYVSDASRWWGAAKIDAEGATFNGGADYTPRTDGRRNLVHERLFINASPDVQEVLPSIPNPPSPFRETQGDRLWRVSVGGNHAAEVAEARRMRNLGCEKITIRYHEDSWRDAGESFTFRLNAAPGRGGDAALRKFVADVRATGWNVGLYTNYIDFASVNSLWDPDHVIRLTNGDWQRAWMRCYAAKPMWGVEMQALLAPQIHAKFGTNHSYCDVATVFMPWEREDYDARVPGAATFRRTYECYGRILCNEKIAYQGPVYSEGRNHWVYAGLSDGNYAQVASDSPSAEPLLVDFDLLKIHPLEMDAGMGAPGMYFQKQPADLDQFIAATLAYGHIGYGEWSTLEGTLKIYNMIQPAQKLYAMVPVQRIEYESDGRMLDTSQAMLSGAYRDSRVHAVYENGTEVYVNGVEKPWTLSAGACASMTLPRWGYAVTSGGRLVCASAIMPGVAAGRRVDISTGETVRYVDSRGARASMADLVCQGSAIVRKEADAWYIIPATAFAELAVAPAVLGLPDGLNVRVTSLTADGGIGPEPDVKWADGMIRIKPPGQPVVKYRVEPRRG